MYDMSKLGFSSQFRVKREWNISFLNSYWHVRISAKYNKTFFVIFGLFFAYSNYKLTEPVCSIKISKILESAVWTRYFSIRSLERIVTFNVMFWDETYKTSD
jgi:hypothetical protein